jgi:hypothetical protein
MMAKRASVEATRMSVELSSTMPPPMQSPLTAAMIGL